MRNDIAFDALHRQGSRTSLMENSIAAIVELLQPQKEKCRKKKNLQCSFACGYANASNACARVHIRAHIHTHVKQTRRGICPDEQTGSSWQTDKSPLRFHDKVAALQRHNVACHEFSFLLRSPRFICPLLPICIPSSQKYFISRSCIEMNNGNFRERFWNFFEIVSMIERNFTCRCCVRTLCIKFLTR